VVLGDRQHTLLRQLSDEVEKSSATCFKPRYISVETARQRQWDADAARRAIAENPPIGAMIDYYF
jgi:hypothetical protein